MNDELTKISDSAIADLYERCHENAPNFGVTADDLRLEQVLAEG